MKTFPVQDDVFSTHAKYSPCKGYRYTLTRKWDAERPTIAFIGLNPSTATETHDDPTLRRCVNYARAWGAGGLVMLNLFAYRATDPREMKHHDAPVGDKNDQAIKQTCNKAFAVVAAWGNHGPHLGRSEAVLNMLQGVHLFCLGTTKENQPVHPLYQPLNLKPKTFRGWWE